MALKPGNYVQGLANILARYGGWGSGGSNTGNTVAWGSYLLPPTTGAAQPPAPAPLKAPVLSGG